MGRELSLFVATFTTLLAIINPFEVLPVYLELLQGKDGATHREIARKSCVYTLLLCLFFLIFGTLILRFFGVSLAMVRIAGGIVLLKIGFALMSSSPPKNSSADGGRGQDTSIAFMPLAMPLMFGPGAIATVIGMASTIKHSPAEWSDFAAVVAAIFATMLVTYLCLIYAGQLSKKLGRMGIDAITRSVGFFVAAMGSVLSSMASLRRWSRRALRSCIDGALMQARSPPREQQVRARRRRSGCVLLQLPDCGNASSLER